MCIMVYLYSRVVYRLWFNPVNNLEASQNAALRYRKQVTIALITVSVIYAVCWMPNLITHLMESGFGKVIMWFDQIGTALLVFNSCVNPVLYSMRMKIFREHLRDMLLCKKRQRARGQAGVASGGSTTGQPINGSEKSACNTAVQTSFSFSSAFRQEMVTTEASLNATKCQSKSLIISLTTVDTGNIEMTTFEGTSTAITESKKATETNSLSSL